jgi:hypothetical protein
MTDHLVTTATRADFATLRQILETQRVRRLDVVIPASQMEFVNGTLVIPDSAAPAITDEGVTSIGGQYVPTEVFDGGLTDRLPITGQYLRYLHQNRLDLYDTNLNALLHGYNPDDADMYERVAPDDRKFFLRLFRGDEDGTGIARALLSDSFKPVDNLDTIVAAFAGLQEAGLGIDPKLPPEKRIKIERCDLTDRHMYVAINAPGIKALAPELLKGYRNPKTGKTADKDPSISAGIVFRNSEVGSGATSAIPRIKFLICANGQTFTKDAFRAVHLTSKREEGVVKYSDDTVAKELALVTAKVRDAVTTFLDVEYLRDKISEMEKLAGVEVTHPADTIKAVVADAGFPKEMENDILNAFTKGGQTTAGGIMQAVTWTAQHADNADVTYDLEDKAQRALTVAARLA